MEQLIVMDQELESNPNESLTTPSRIQKCLFNPSSSSSKRSLFRENKELRKDIDSDAESDLGPMSPLALTDHSSCDSSPGRPFVSPLATPEKSPTIPLTRWSCLVPSSRKNSLNKIISPFSSLKKVTRSARFSPKRVFSLSPSKIAQIKCNNENNISEVIVPETPGKESDFDDQHSYVAETPQKEELPEYRLITPLGSVCKSIPIPRIHRRKSLSVMDLNQSPEIKKSSCKRHLEDSLIICSSKYQKTDEWSNIPKARASLFQENKSNNEKEKGFTVNPRSFYGSNNKKYNFIGHEWKEFVTDVKNKRRSLPLQNYSLKRSGKRSKKGEINCGVGHGIRKPKVKRQTFHNAIKNEKQNEDANKQTESKENLNPEKNKRDTKNKIFDVDANKKFFKSKPGQSGVVTVNEKLKLKIAQKDIEHINKRAKLDKTCFDATDLSVDEPAVESSLEKTKVDNILKILEDDWADDEYDMETVQMTNQILSPEISNKIRLKNVTMSPGSELSNMASTMNIDDLSQYDSKISKEYNDFPPAINTKKFYPLFSKGYSSNVGNENKSKKCRRSHAWQLSVKSGKTENQYQIDAGQKIFGAIQCNECGIVYQIGEPEDENAHLNFHNSFKTLKFQGWKNERVIFRDSYTSSRIILIEPKDSNLYWKKVDEILEIVDRDLGLSDMKLSFYRDKKIYMYVRDKTIIGILVAEYVKNAFRMIPEFLELNCCTSETTSVKCGINVVWTPMSHRRQGIATKLLDILRANYYYGYIMSMDDIAFSTPTPSGKLFAEKYTKTRNFKVY